jgi:N-acyl homoserine lactone hydrolase
MSNGLTIHPMIHRLDLGLVRLPDWHPRADDKVAPIYAYAVEHPDGVVLFDCGCGTDNEEVNSRYRPIVNPLEETLATFGIGLTDVKAAVLSHLHFDHCGQLRSIRGRPVYVQGAEIEAARAPDYTVADWAAIPDADRHIVDGDETIAPGLTIVSSPGHTPGHQSLVVKGGNTTTIIGGQCCYCVSNFNASNIEADNLFDDRWESIAKGSMRKLMEFKPNRLLLAHDARDWFAS